MAAFSRAHPQNVIEGFSAGTATLVEGGMKVTLLDLEASDAVTTRPANYGTAAKSAEPFLRNLGQQRVRLPSLSRANCQFSPLESLIAPITPKETR